MLPKPEVQYNTFVLNEDKIDPISKLFIYTEMIFGINLLPVLGNVKPFYLIVAYIFSAIVITIHVFVTINSVFWQLYAIILIIDTICMVLIIVLSSILWKRLCNYFTALSLIDSEIGFKLKYSLGFIPSIIQLSSSVLVFSILYTVYFSNVVNPPVILIILVPMKFLQAIVYYFNGHLLDLLFTRHKLINDCLELSYPHTKTYGINSLLNEIKVKNAPKRVKMCKFIVFYYNLIKAYDTLNDAIKWQLLLSFIKTFVISLGDLYYLVTDVIAHRWELNRFMISSSIAVIQFVPMFSVCGFGDALHKEVLKLRDMLACRLYEYKLDKQDRRNAQALLTLTEARNLSFSLFHLFNIDISLPFKILALLVTYLIIMLQFEKVNG